MTCRICGFKGATKRLADGPARRTLCTKHLRLFLASTFGARYKAGQHPDAQLCAWIREQLVAGGEHDEAGLKASHPS